MVEFDELRHLWQSQHTPDTPRALDGRAMTEVLRRFHRRETAINCLRAGCLVFLLIWGSMHAPNRAALLGIFFMVIGLTIYLVIDWRNQLGIARLDFTQPSVEFVESGIQRLYDMRYPFRKTFWLFIVSSAVGLNLIRMFPVNPVPWYRQVVAHLTATTAPFFAYAFGLWVRNRRFETTARPILDKLLSLREALQEVRQ